MRVIYNEITDPYFNLASEEYLMETATDDVFMLWRNAPAVIIGKNQNAWAEINVPFTEENNIAVVRRMTGGGAVFHDLGNVNFSFITESSDRTRLNFAKFTEPIIKALANTGIEASLDGRNDLTANGYKISGNAQCIRKNALGIPMMLHHGTLLFGADMEKLSGALRVNAEKLKSKGIKSVRSRVQNISDIEGYCGEKTVEGFMKALLSGFAAKGEVTGFSDDEINGITELRNSKYAAWEWNFGASPEFETTKERRFDWGSAVAMMTCRRGTIEEIKIYGDFFGSEDISLLEEKLTGCALEKSAIANCMGELAGKCIFGASPEDVASLLTD